MLQNEFEARTGYTPTMEEWSEINAAYMRSADNKDTFCEKWSAANSAKVASARRAQKEMQKREAMQESVINRVLRFVYGRAVLDRDAMQDVLRRVLGRFYGVQDARQYAQKVWQFAGVTQNWSDSEWRKYWYIHSAIAYGL